MTTANQNNNQPEILTDLQHANLEIESDLTALFRKVEAAISRANILVEIDKDNAKTLDKADRVHISSAVRMYEDALKVLAKTLDKVGYAGCYLFPDEVA